jgi:hypothetical protein
MKGKCRGRDIELFGNFTCGYSFNACGNEQAEDSQPGILGQRGQCSDGSSYFHSYSIVEMSIVSSKLMYVSLSRLTIYGNVRLESLTYANK